MDRPMQPWADCPEVVDPPSPLLLDAIGDLLDGGASTALATGMNGDLLLQAILSVIPLVLFVCDRDGRLLLSSGAALTARGYRAGAGVGTSLPERYAARPAVLRCLRRALAGEASALVAEEAGRRYDTRYLPWRADDGRVIGVVGIALDITARQRSADRIALVSAVAGVLGAAECLDDALAPLVRLLCEHLGWDIGAAWTREGDLLRCRFLHEASGTGAKADGEGGGADFALVTRSLRLAPGDSLVGRAWEGRGPLWLADVTTEPGFQRALAARRAHLHGAMALPLDDGRRPCAVLEFFDRAVRERDHDTLALLEVIGAQVRQFLGRLEAEEALLVGERRLEQILARAPILLFACDQAGRITLYEGSGLAGQGHLPGELLGRSIEELHGGDASVAAMLCRALGGKEVTATVCLGGVAHSLHLVPERRDGAVIGVLGIATPTPKNARAHPEERPRR